MTKKSKCGMLNSTSPSEVEYSGVIKDPYGFRRAGLSAKTEISRKEWGLTWHTLLETSGAVVGDEVKIELDIEAVTEV